MLQLKNIYKTYQTGDFMQEALDGVRLNFRENEFVAVLGASGSGKTTLLNIIGGLDRYDKGDLIINGKSTKKFKDKDWDSYRNHSVGFVFQNYNLIPHQSVLSNVELALTLSGVSRAERRQRAVDVLKKVGLEEHIHKKPNQMSGGQMQRVAIARALINNPTILLADEPTGALDSETSVQIMDLLKEISKDKLIIMVTHNPDLANTYANRIIKLMDGNVIDDSNPYLPEKESEEQDFTKKEKKARKTSMSFFTALSLSLNNLMTKKARTILTSFAGSIGIIGIALILALSSGVQGYIDSVEEDTLSSYPISIESQALDMTTLMSTMMGTMSNEETTHDKDKIYSSNIMNDMMKSLTAQVGKNDLQAFKEYIENEDNQIDELSNAIQYGYNLDLQIYKADTTDEIKQVNPSTLFEDIGFTPGGMASMTGSSGMMSINAWEEMLGNQELLNSQYDVLQGEWPSAYNEVVLVVDENNEISDAILYSLGMLDSSDLPEIVDDLLDGKDVSDKLQDTTAEYTYDDILNLKFKLVLNTDYYEKTGSNWANKSDDENYMKELIDDAVDINIVGIIRPKEESVSSALSGAIGYTTALTEYVIDNINDSEIVKQQKDNPDTDVFTGKPFANEEEDTNEQVDLSSLSEEERAYFATLSEEELQAIMENYSKTASTTYDDNLLKLGVVNYDNPSAINIYPKDFESKEALTTAIDNYNQMRLDANEEQYVINYSDLVGLMMSSVTAIINIISYVLIAFVSISLVVSSIMIGIITYISVLERTKEIGILRSIGASKKDISRVFNAETLIVGLTAGILGILVTLLLTIPANSIIYSLTGVPGIVALPWQGALILIAISTILTFISGLIPSKIAAKKDPVEALRTE